MHGPRSQLRRGEWPVSVLPLSVHCVVSHYHWVFTMRWVTTIECSPCGESLPLSIHCVVSHDHCWVFLVWWVTATDCSLCGESLPLAECLLCGKSQPLLSVHRVVSHCHWLNVHCVVSHYHWLIIHCVSHYHCWVFTVWWWSCWCCSGRCPSFLCVIVCSVCSGAASWSIQLMELLML